MCKNCRARPCFGQYQEAGRGHDPGGPVDIITKIRQEYLTVCNDPHIFGLL
jgi:hypothetical protein